MRNAPIQITDEYFNLHLQGKLLGQGGQGAVYRSKDPDIALKLVTDASGVPVTDPEQIASYFDRLRNVRLLPIPTDLNISIPMALLKDQAGYVMQLLSDMVSFTWFWPDAESSRKTVGSEKPAWLGNMQEDPANMILHYRDTGGLRRRLTALYKYSSILARIHGNGFVYGDISPNNAYISSDSSRSEVWLIDADNFRFETAISGVTVFTPKYGAPEVVQGLDGSRPRSDCHAFAVMAFHMLVMIHPFIGNKVNGSDSDWAEGDEGDDIETKAYAGHLPWVDDGDDDSNSAAGGLPRELVLTAKLSKLFQQTFGPGRTIFWKRPAIYHWPEALAEAGDQTIVCSSCKMSWFFNVPGDTCPYCSSAKGNQLLVRSFAWNGEKQLDAPCWTFARELTDPTQVTVLPERLFASFSMKSSDTPVLELSINRLGLLLTKVQNCRFNLSVALSTVAEGRFKELASHIQLPRQALSDGFWVYTDSDVPRLLNFSVLWGNREH